MLCVTNAFPENSVPHTLFSRFLVAPTVCDVVFAYYAKGTVRFALHLSPDVDHST